MKRLREPHAIEESSRAIRMGDATQTDVLRQLRQVLESAANLTRRLEGSFNKADLPPGADATDLERQLLAAESDRQALTSQLVEAEHQAGKLMGLYVATYQLHASLDPAEVQSAIAEISRDLLGAERFVLLLKDEDRRGCEVALAEGIEEDPGQLFNTGFYSGGDSEIDTTLNDGVVRISAVTDGSAPLAVVPLRVDETTVGALVILKLRDHRVTPLSDDRDILDLLAAHAASALFAARVCSRADRKLRTLESLVQLMRGS